MKGAESEEGEGGVPVGFGKREGRRVAGTRTPPAEQKPLYFLP